MRNASYFEESPLVVNALATLVVAIIAGIITYGVLAFTLLEPNPLAWSALARWVLALATVGSGAWAFTRS